ncbi:hypothetical protein [Vibrio neptunius]|uniref:hypothetical protein n=1 Tax=Vibrio neptunius TaxID=170651 RepID=UPI0019D18F84|nr:hypothetical protein [Vibrio neptunius]MBN3575981.1 hypothetical protein [Vibrio neptunius]QXX05859.1 hypothetical protein KW548_11870 [Vibrio neptunius]
MDWKYIKFISMIVGIVLIATFAFILGISFGVSYDKGSLTEIVIPALSALGGWVAGLGALGAVFTSLWLAEQQRKNSGENLKCVFDVFVIQGMPDDALGVVVTSHGNKPSNINSITIHSSDSTVAMSIQQFEPSSAVLPTYLPYGQQASYLLSSDFKQHINDYVDKHCSGSYRNLLLSVNTTTDSFKVKFGKNVLEHLK